MRLQTHNIVIAIFLSTHEPSPKGAWLLSCPRRRYGIDSGRVSATEIPNCPQNASATLSTFTPAEGTDMSKKSQSAPDEGATEVRQWRRLDVNFVARCGCSGVDRFQLWRESPLQHHSSPVQDDLYLRSMDIHRMCHFIYAQLLYIVQKEDLLISSGKHRN